MILFMNKELTGYLHIDKPWMKFYDKKLVKMDDPKVNITQYLKDKTRGLDNNIATIYHGKKQDYKNFFNDVDDASKVLFELGIRDHDCILNLVSNIPDAGHIFLGAAQIGAVSDFTNPSINNFNSKKLLDLINFEKCKYVVALDQFYLKYLKPIENELMERGINKIITLSIFDSMNIFSKINYLFDVVNYNNLKSTKGLKWYQAILRKIKLVKELEDIYDESVKSSPIDVVKYSNLLKEIKYSNYENYYEENQVIYLSHSLNNKGNNSKVIELTNENLISSSQQLNKVEDICKSGDKVLQIFPLSSSLGASNNYILNLASGATNIEVSEFDKDDIGYLIMKYQPSVIFLSTFSLISLMKCKYLDVLDLSFIKRVIYTGDYMTKMDELRLNTWFRIHNCKIDIEKCYSINEIGGCGSYSNGNYNEYESIGIPLPNTIYSIVNPDMEKCLEPVKFNDNDKYIEGELVISSNAVCNNKTFELDGKSYIRTGDIVRVDRNGLFYFLINKNRIFYTYDGVKVNPYEIERVIEHNYLVKYCKIVSYYDDSVKGNLIKANIVLEDNVDSSRLDIITEQIINKSGLSLEHIPNIIKYRDSLPLYNNEKINYKELEDENLDGTEINIRVDNDNNIEIIVPYNKVKKR